jgi:hypothetical protein
VESSAVDQVQALHQVTRLTDDFGADTVLFAVLVVAAIACIPILVLHLRARARIADREATARIETQLARAAQDVVDREFDRDVVRQAVKKAFGVNGSDGLIQEIQDQIAGIARDLSAHVGVTRPLPECEAAIRARIDVAMTSFSSQLEQEAEERLSSMAERIRTEVLATAEATSRELVAEAARVAARLTGGSPEAGAGD